MTDEFYVGYLSLPKGYRRFLLVLLPLLVIGAIAAAVVMTSQQNDPGDGSWNLSEPIEHTGILTTAPYPMLIVNSEPGIPARRILLATTGKLGGDNFALPDNPHIATISGYPIGRERTLLLTIENAERDIKIDRPTALIGDIESLGRATLIGQIIDPKCYFGAMKPGEGKVHKACATLCIRGGIPPMFITHDIDGNRTDYLLVDQNGRGLTGDALTALLPFIADPVKIEGRIERHDNLLIFRIDPARIERL